MFGFLNIRIPSLVIEVVSADIAVPPAICLGVGSGVKRLEITEHS